MPKRCIGIDIGRSHVCAAQVTRTAEGFRLEKAFAMQTRRSTDSLPAILDALTDKYGFDRHANMAVSLPLHAFFFANIETDAQGLERIRAADPAGLKDYFPIPADDIIAQVCSVPRGEAGKHSVLVAASSRRQLHAGLQTLSDSRIRPVCLDTPITAVHKTIVVNHAQAGTGLAVILYVDQSTLSLAVMQEGNLLLVRNIPMFSSEEHEAEAFAQQTAEIIAQEIEITWRRLFGNDPDPGLRIFLAAPRPMTAALVASLQDKANAQVIPVNPYARVTWSQEQADTDLPLCVAEGLALRVLEPGPAGQVNFLAAYRARTRPGLRMTRELTVCAALAAAAVVVWTVGLFLQLSSLESNYGQLKKQAEEVFRRAVPEEQNVVDPAAQLQQRLEAFRKEGEVLSSLHSGHPAPLDILSALSRSTPASGSLKLQDVRIAADAVRITGSCDSFATLSQWQCLLEAIPGLHVEDVPRPTKDARSGKVQFTISLSTRESKA